MFSTESLLTSFSQRYKIALLVIAILISCSFFIITFEQKKQESYAHVINVAGEQRMLSQRVALLASYALNTQQSDYHKQE